MPYTVNPTHLTASGLIKTGPGTLRSAILAGGSAASTLTIYDNTAGSGTIILSLKALANSNGVAVDLGYVFKTGCYADLAGTGATATIGFD